MDRKAVHRLVSAAIYYVAFFVLLFPVAAATIFATEPFSGGWAVIVGILVFLIAAGFAIKAFEALRRWRTKKFYRLSFPAYEGERYPAFHLISHEAGGQLHYASPPLDMTSIAEADDRLFLLKYLQSDRPEERIGGSVVRNPATRQEWSFARDRVLAIEVFEMTDEAIKAAAVDKRDYGERLVQEGVNRLFGVKTKRKIVPFAAYVTITALPPGEEPGWIESWTFAIPTEIHGTTMYAIGIGPKAADTELVDSAIEHGVKKAQGAVIAEAHDQLTDLIGAAPVDLADDIIDLKSDIDYWVNLGAAKIATTDGARGRAYARIVAERVRRWAGLDRVHIATLDGNA